MRFVTAPVVQMAESHYIIPVERGVIGVGGEDRATFLQGLVSNDTGKITPARAIFAALLTPQGKFLFDLFIAEADGRYLIDCEKARLGDLIRRLRLYKLRSRVEIADLSADFAPVVIYGKEAASGLDHAAQPGHARALDGGIIFADPRLLALGARAILPRAGVAAIMAGLDIAPGSAAAYENLRLGLGVPAGESDLVPEKSILLECGLDELSAIDWQKGCYMGQELTARTRYRGLVRKRLLPVTITGPRPAVETPLILDGRTIGELRSVSSDGARGLAMLRLEYLKEVQDSAPTCGEATLAISIPDWMRLPDPSAA